MYVGDPFAVLGVSPDIDKASLSKHFRKLARSNHPDVGGDHDRYVELQSAYQAITSESYSRITTGNDQFTMQHTSLFTFEKVGI